MARLPHPIPYQGSKRRLAGEILRYAPQNVTTLVEPFCGSAALSIAAAGARPDLQIELNDSLPALCQLWRDILHAPQQLADEYDSLWHEQHDNPSDFYRGVRARFNRHGGAADLLFLLTRCVKNAVRFNAEGHFNQSEDRRRLGASPDRMRDNILRASQLLGTRTTVHCGDYAHCLQAIGPQHLVYCDPPYEGTSGARNRRYHQGLDRDKFVEQLRRLVSLQAQVIVSLDGRCGTKHYGTQLPESLGLQRVEIAAGRSSQATLSGRNEQTVESLYLSPGLSAWSTKG